MPRFLGQHFLKRGSVIHRILMSLNLQKNDRVLEIGPGRGALTQPLAEKVGALLLIEKDPRLFEVLQQKYSGLASVSLRHGDFLEFPWEEITAVLGTDFKVVSNLPYQVSTAILTKLLNHVLPGTRMVLMFQKEVASRLLSGPRSKDYGSLSVFVQIVAELRLLFDVPPQAFLPPPKVFSAVVSFRVRENPLVAKGDWPAFEALLHAGFRQRRKMLRQNLRPHFQGCSAEAIEERLARVGASPQARAEELSVEQWVNLFVR